MENEILKLKNIIDTSEYIVFLGGAGVSTESNIPDFRSSDGLYSKKYPYPAEIMLSHSFFVNNMEDFFDFYKNNMLYLDALPNKAHHALSRLEAQGKLKAVITQNIDGLHQLAGSENVLELHGSVHRNYCMKCRKIHNPKIIVESENIPICSCGGVIKPDVVLYEESLDNLVYSQSIFHIKNADTLIIAGTSLAVYPAASLVNYFRGKNLVVINKSATGRESQANLVINAPIGEVLHRAMI